MKAAPALRQLALGWAQDTLIALADFATHELQSEALAEGKRKCNSAKERKASADMQNHSRFFLEWLNDFWPTLCRLTLRKRGSLQHEWRE